jgi:hypothetical protein
MPDNRDLDQPDRPEEIQRDDDDIVGIGEDDDEFEDAEEEDDEIFDDEPRGMSPTDEVGSEGGSEGNAVALGRAGLPGAGGTEATETLRPSDRDRRPIETSDESGVPVRRSPTGA